jgi:AcrR family transcriptional regulator
MKQNKRDRRSQRTRQLVLSATLALLFERRYDEITVQDILDRANIGRSTFYTHYFDKQDVLTSIVEQQIELLTQQLAERNAEHTLIPSLEMFQHVQRHEQYFRAMLRGEAGEPFWEAAQSGMTRAIEQALAGIVTIGVTPRVPVPIVAQYLAGALLNLLKWWVVAESHYSPEQMDEMFQRLALPGMWATLDRQQVS